MNYFLKSFLVLSITLLTACSNTANNDPIKVEGKKVGGNMTAQKDSKVKVHYKGTLADGSVFDESPADQPLEFVLGSGQLIKGFDTAVEGMKVGEEKTVNIPSQDAYGERHDQLIQEFPKTFFPKDFTPTEGAFITLQDQSGRPVPGQIVEIGEEKVKIDLNHPLSGKDLTFNIKVVSIE